MHYRELNLDGLVGPTHNYAGLSTGNVASMANRGAVSNPRAAALQGLAKAMALADRGYLQGILPPHLRPEIDVLRSWGFSGPDDASVLASAARRDPALLAAAGSASAMWTANACTVAPSCDTADGRLHITPANLSSKLHRSIEPPFTRQVLRAIFADEERFAVHSALEGGDAMADEGAANHTRFWADPAGPGLHLFVYGRSALDRGAGGPQGRFPARQTRESCLAIARRHRLQEGSYCLLQQSSRAIDAGVFHNDVIAVGHGNFLLFHESAFESPAGQSSSIPVSQLQEQFRRLTGRELLCHCVREADLPLGEAVTSYLFNSQLLEREQGGLLMVVPHDCWEAPASRAVLEGFLSDYSHPVQEILPFHLRESMRNGGGPACLRQRIPVNASELRHLKGRILLDASLYADLTAWVNKHYRDQLRPEDLADPSLLEESRRALDELTAILHLPGLYAFQR